MDILHLNGIGKVEQHGGDIRTQVKTDVNLRRRRMLTDSACVLEHITAYLILTIKTVVSQMANIVMLSLDGALTWEVNKERYTVPAN